MGKTMAKKKVPTKPKTDKAAAWRGLPSRRKRYKNRKTNGNHWALRV